MLEYLNNPCCDMLTNSSFNISNWQDQIKAREYVMALMLQMVWRKGEYVAWDRRIQCFIEPGSDNQFDNNFKVKHRAYVAKLSLDELVKIPVIEMLGGLLPIDQWLLLRLSLPFGKVCHQQPACEPELLGVVTVPIPPQNASGP